MWLYWRIEIVADKQVNNLLTGPKDQIELALLEADRKIKKERTRKIGALLDKATDVLSDVLDTDDRDHERMRMQAAELTIGLYTSQETAERADRQLDLQAKRLEVEAKKVGINTLLLQQNNFNAIQPPNQPPRNLVTQSDGSVVDVDLLARKKAQQMILDAQLGIISEEAIEETEETDEMITIEDSDTIEGQYK